MNRSDALVLLQCRYGSRSSFGGTMSHHVLAIYDNPREASLAVDRLIANGISEAAISVVASEGFRSQYLGVEGGTKGAAGVAAGVALLWRSVDHLNRMGIAL
jgi:hypothetical protein